ncbi:MAG TPA: hypothetical protein VLC46_00875 [Thermoanaerobaculia bacterium]|jgi:hypothetical protein|nr:hypothetical protein [Thermoanaerobaculia bacterium]
MNPENAKLIQLLQTIRCNIHNKPFPLGPFTEFDDGISMEIQGTGPTCCADFEKRVGEVQKAAQQDADKWVQANGRPR